MNSPSPSNTKVFLVGVTGGIGSGKSIACRLFALLGIPIYDADSRAKWLMGHDQILKNAVRNAFGEEAYDKEGMLNRAYLSKKVFHDKEKLKQLNSLVHPKVGEDFQLWVDAHKKKAPYLIKEAALLFETGSFSSLDVTINVSAPEGLRIDRVRKRDGRPDEQIKAIISKQLPEKARQKNAGHTIWNDGKSLLIPQILALHQQFSSMASAR